MKRVILFVIDALSGPLLVQEMENGRYPHFQQLRDASNFHEQCVSIFPSITHAALTSIVTGAYPAQHGVVGSHWYEVEQGKVVYFSGSLGMVLQKGLGNFFREFLLDLNHKHLKALTIFQTLERDGYDTACINFPLYRGDVDHEVNMPLLLSWIPDLPNSTIVQGPKKLLLGDLLSNPNELDIEASMTGVAHWFGFRDENTIDLVLQMADKDEFPDFALAYFPENDDRSHKNGPCEAHQHLSDLDEMLGKLFDTYGGLDAFLEQFMLVITGDHSQSETLADGVEEGVDLSELLADFRLAEAGQPWQEDDDIMPCPNLRAGHLYFKNPDMEQITAVSHQLLTDPRIDQVIFRADGDGYVILGENGRLHFQQSDSGSADRYGNTWDWDGELSVVDGRVEDGRLVFGDYPNAFERIAGVLDSKKSGQLWMTAKIGHEIVVPLMKAYVGGGSHASLHRLDSQPPLLVAGAPDHVKIPEFPRIVDVAPLCRACIAE